VSAPQPTVSVLLPVRDGGVWLDEAIESVLGQTFEDFELIVVDDGSSDDTPDRLSAQARRDDRVRPIRQDPAGIVAALERGRAEARGRFLARMDADDVAEPERLSRQAELMRDDPSLAGCGCGVRYFPRSEVRPGARRYEAWLNAATTPGEVEEALFVECPLAHPTFFLRAEAVEAVGGYRDPGWPEDYDLVLRLWRAGHRLANVPDVLHRWRERPDRLSRTGLAYAPEAFRACKVHHLRRSLLPDGRDAVVWGAGPVGKAFARALADAGTGIAAFVELDPRKIGQEIHGAPVLDTDGGVEVRGPLHLAAVGQQGARGRIRALLRSAGLHPVRDFVAVA
jgi:cellulose synthase/poly-beta-1,6-N-acetylglucosamine synthase-like glycosyltransferase